MSLIIEITNRVAALTPAKQREALQIIEKLAAQQKSSADERRDLSPLKGATARPGKRSVSVAEIAEARREMWGKFD